MGTVIVVTTCGPEPDSRITVLEALINIVREPRRYLLLRWNWKAALFSALWRGGIFFAANVTSGIGAAAGAMSVEATYRIVTAGFYGAVTQRLSQARPPVVALLTALLLVPTLAHTMEFLIHSARGTPNLRRSMVASIGFTGIATLFNVHAMSRGVLTVGPGSRSVLADLRALPATLRSFFRVFLRHTEEPE